MAATDRLLALCKRVRSVHTLVAALLSNWESRLPLFRVAQRVTTTTGGWLGGTMASLVGRHLVGCSLSPPPSIPRNGEERGQAVHDPSRDASVAGSCSYCFGAGCWLFKAHLSKAWCVGPRSK